MSIEVWVGNLGKYNNGELVGAWFSLPMAPEAIDEKLRKDVLIGTRDSFGCVYEEFGIFDYEFDNDLEELGYKPDMWDSLQYLNLLATFCENADDIHLEAVRAYTENIKDLTVLELCNMVIQADELPYYRYGCRCNSPEESYGLMFWNEFVHLDGMDKDHIAQFIDFEALGRYYSADDYLGDEGYLIGGNYRYPDENFYSRDELIQLAAEIGWC